MKFFQKLKKRFGKIKEKASRTSPIIMAGRSEAIWPDRDYENFSREAYMKCIVSYRCIDYISKSFSSVEWKVFTKEDNKRVDVPNHPFMQLMKRPNPHESFSFLLLKAMAFYLISGNTYIERVTPDTGPNTEIPVELFVQRPDRMEILVDKITGLIKGYKYTVNGRDVMWEVDPITQQCDILHIKTFHPADDWLGLAVVEPAAREIDTFNEGTEWNKKLLQNEGRPGLVFTVVGNLSDQQYSRLEKQLLDKYSGPENAGRSMIVEGETGTKVAPYAWTPAEMEFIEGNREMARRICNGFGVPPMLLGIPGDNTYSNYKEARLDFWETTIIYYLKFFKGELNNWLFGKDEYFLDYDLNDIPALEPRREERWKKANEAKFLTENEKRELVGYESVSGGDIILVASNLVPLTVMLEDDTDGLSEDEKAVKRLSNLGYTAEQIEDMLGRND